MKGGEITTNINEIQKIIRTYFKKNYIPRKGENPKEMNEFLDACNITKLYHPKYTNIT